MAATIFWVNGSDHNSAIEVSVVTGKVSVSEYGKANSTKTSKIKDGVILTANQRVKYTTQTHSFETGLVSNPIPVATDKKGKPFEGSFVFEDNSFSDVIGRREKAYGIEIIPGSQNTAGSMLSRLGIYLTPWQGRLITNDFRANRTNSFKLAEQGSGYALKQMEDLMWTDDVAFRPVDINVGPDGAIKEGYDLNSVVKKDGSETMGYLASESASEIVIRDVTGKEVSIPKSQVKLMEKVPGSLMLPGLTAGLGKQEFIDLIGFLSKIGESGKFRVANTRFVRRWESLTGDNQTTAKMLANRSFPAKGKGITTRPVYSKVSGALPLDELPEPENGSKRVSIVRFEIDVMTQGMVSLAFNATAAITAWTAGKPVKLTDSGMAVDVPQGV